MRLNDKSRGPGGRLTTRRLAWVDPQGQTRVTRLARGDVPLDANIRSYLSVPRVPALCKQLLEGVTTNGTI